MRPYQIWRHALGRPTGEDTCVWEESDARFYLKVGTTKDGALIVLSAGSNTTSEVRVLDAAEADGEPRLVEARRQGIEYSIEHHRDEILVLSNDGAENFAAFRTPAATPGRAHWCPLVAHRDDVRLESLDVVEGFALLHERGHASTAVRIVDLAGGAESVITPPEEAGAVFLGENLDFSARRIRYSSTSVVSPVAVHEYDLDTGQAKVIWRRLVPNYDSTAYRTERRWATSEDGTRVPDHARLPRGQAGRARAVSSVRLRRVRDQRQPGLRRRPVDPPPSRPGRLLRNRPRTRGRRAGACVVSGRKAGAETAQFRGFHRQRPVPRLRGPYL